MVDQQPARDVTSDEVKSWAHITGPEQDSHIELVVAATNALVGSLPVTAGYAAGAAWPAQVRLAAIMLASRLLRRRNSPSGVEAMTESGAAYVSRYDPDVARMLELDDYARPAVG